MPSQMEPMSLHWKACRSLLVPSGAAQPKWLFEHMAALKSDMIGELAVAQIDAR